MVEKCPKTKPKCASRSAECTTINLAKEGLSLEDRKTKLLVYEKRRFHPIIKPKPEFQLPVGLTATPRTAKKVRMCATDDIKTICPAPCLNSPPKPRGLMSSDFFKKGIKLSLKSALVGSIIYTTWQMGLWGTAKDTECVWNSLKQTLFGPDVQPGVPCTDVRLYKASEKWNQAVTKSFLYLACCGRSIQTYLNPPPIEKCVEEKKPDEAVAAGADPCTCK